MAIFGFDASVVTRGKGKSAVAAAAYRSGSKLEDERQGLTFDYRRKKEIEHSEIMTPDGAPTWAKDRQSLWNRAEAAEKRADGRPARELVLTLPRELTPDQRLELVREFVRLHVISRGLVADISIHNPAARDGQDQPHAHVMVTTRALDASRETGLSKNKDRELAENGGQVENLRESWANHVNHHLEMAGSDERVDHRSLAKQLQEAEELVTAAENYLPEALANGGDPDDWADTIENYRLRAATLNRPAEPKIGPKALKMERQGFGDESIALQNALEVRQIRRELIDAAAELAETRDRVTEIKGNLVKMTRRFAEFVTLAWSKIQAPAEKEAQEAKKSFTFAFGKMAAARNQHDFEALTERIKAKKPEIVAKWVGKAQAAAHAATLAARAKAKLDADERAAAAERARIEAEKRAEEAAKAEEAVKAARASFISTAFLAKPDDKTDAWTLGLKKLDLAELDQIGAAQGEEIRQLRVDMSKQKVKDPDYVKALDLYRQGARLIQAEVISRRPPGFVQPIEPWFAANRNTEMEARMLEARRLSDAEVLAIRHMTMATFSRLDDPASPNGRALENAVDALEIVLDDRGVEYGDRPHDIPLEVEKKRKPIYKQKDDSQWDR